MLVAGLGNRGGWPRVVAFGPGTASSVQEATLSRRTVVVAAALVGAVALGVAAWIALPWNAGAPSAGPASPTPVGDPGLPPITPAGAPVGSCSEALTAAIPLERVGGRTPAATAACTALTGWAGGADRAVIATGTREALLAAPLAGQLEAPILLVEPDGLPGETVTALTDLEVVAVTLIGAASDRLVAALEEVVGSVEHVSADSLPQLSIGLADRTSSDDRVYISGSEPAELIVAAAAATRDGADLVVLEGAAGAAVTDQLRGAEEVVAVGHPSTLPDEWLAPLRATSPVVRVDGPDVAGTAAGMARRQDPNGRLHLVPTDPDSLAHAVVVPWLATQDEGPVLLATSDGLPAETGRWLRLDGTDTSAARLISPAPAVGLVTAVDEAVLVGADGAPPPEVRGAWAHLFDDSLKTRAGITEFLDQAVATGLNTVVVQVARRQDAYYTSTILPRTADPALEEGLDLLAELLPRAHARGLEVHAWVAVVQAYHQVYDELPSPDGWVWTRHGPGSDEPWVTRPHPERADALGYPAAYRDYPYLDLGVPAVQDHITATLVEIASKYPVDAVHLDYLRYPGQAWGYHPIALRRYAEETGASVDPVPAVDDPAWSDWRREQATRLLERVRDEVGAARPGIAISAAVIAQGDGPAPGRPFEATIAYSELMQDWVGWVRSGLIDLTIPMAYFDERRYAARYDRWVSLASQLRSEGAAVAIGQGSWLNPTSMSLSQAQQALSDTDGLVLYSYQQDTWCPAGTAETGEPCSPVEAPRTLWRQLADGPFAEPAPAP